MANLFVAVVTVAIILAAMSGLARGSVLSQGTVSDSLKTARDQTGDIARTAMSSLGAAVLLAGSEVEVSVRNDGQTALRGFSKWDLLMTYEGVTGLEIQRLAYTADSSPSSGEWTMKGIYKVAASATDEVFQPGIVNTGEEFIIKAALSPAISSPSDNSLVLAVDNGTALTVAFTN
ncbi:MAG: hypothetical protein HQ548_07335 [Chloroflexi bacterium]|nr:hypothetical protein [Chloroflexota bacterium]